MGELIARHWSSYNTWSKNSTSAFYPAPWLFHRVKSRDTKSQYQHIPEMHVLLTSPQWPPCSKFFQLQDSFTFSTQLFQLPI